MDDADVIGPLFISIGDQDKLRKFLDLNPNVPRDKTFVDDYNFGAYNAAGFGSFTDTSKGGLKNVKMAAPSLGGFGTWWKYLSNVVALSPIEKGSNGIPEGVKRVGGTFIVRGNDVIYQWSDKVPGDTPNSSDVLRMAKEASTK